MLKRIQASPKINNADTQHIIESLNGFLTLTVSLWMLSYTEPHLNAKILMKSVQELRCEPCVSTLDITETSTPCGTPPPSHKY